MIRLPTPPEQYDIRDQSLLRQAVEGILARLWVSTSELPTPALAGYIKATIANDVADLTVYVAAAISDLPVTVRVWEDAPTGAAIVETTVSETAATLTSVDEAALGSRSLPLREVRRWWLELVSAKGHTVWAGPTAADRDALPGGAATPVPGGTLKCEYDDDTDTITITTPSGVKTYGGLSGGGTVEYLAGTTALDDASLEAALTLDEVRDGYRVDYTGGGETRTMFRGALVGLNHDFAVPQLDVKVTPYDDRYDFEYTQTEGDLYRRITSDSGGDTGFVGILTGTGLTFSVFRIADEDQTVQLRGVLSNGQDTNRSFTITRETAAAPTGYFTTVSQALWSTATDEVDFSWGYTGDSAYFQLFVREGGGAWALAHTTATGASTYRYTTSADLTAAVSPTVDIEFYAVARSAAGDLLIAQSEISLGTYGTV